MYLFFIFQLYFQVSQHKHQDNIHSSVQWKERKTGGPGVPSEACATPDLSLNNKHSRQHGSPDQPSPFSHRNYQVFKPCSSHTGRCAVAGWRPPSIHVKYFAFVIKVELKLSIICLGENYCSANWEDSCMSSLYYLNLACLMRGSLLRSLAFLEQQRSVSFSCIPGDWLLFTPCLWHNFTWDKSNWHHLKMFLLVTVPLKFIIRKKSGFCLSLVWKIGWSLSPEGLWLLSHCWK